MCTRPNYAIYIKSNDPGIPGYLKFINLHVDDNYRTLKEKYQDKIISLPCGQCEECRKDYATQWAIRIALEASKYQNNWFVTLTYDNAHYRDLNKEDIQEFINNLSGKKKKEFLYWIAGEYGPTTKRAHYHMILMNFDIKPEPIAKSPLGNTIYKSTILEKAWRKGYIEIQEAGDNAAAYCAKYASKNAKDGFKPMMSKGIGLSELIKNKDFINKYGYIQGQNGKKYKIPRYYFKKILDEEAQALKERQIKKGIRKTAERSRYRHLEYSLKEKEEILNEQRGARRKI